MNEFIIELEKIGINNPTRVTHNGRVLETQQLDIEALCDLWKRYYHIPHYTKIVLLMDERTYHMIDQKTLASIKSVRELFAEQGIECRKRSED